MRRIAFLSLAALLLSAALILPGAGPARAQSGSGSNWSGEYFNNRDLVGTAIFVRLDNAINFDWGGNSPMPGIVPADNFSVRWTAAQFFNAGTYVFTATADDGVRVFVDNQLIIDGWRDQQRTTYTGQMTLSQGSHWVRVEYYDSGDQAAISFSWIQAGTQGASGGWAAEYYNNAELFGPQAGGRLEPGPTIDYNWGASSPIPGTINNENFSARWWGFPEFAGGVYTFVAGADDGVRVWVDNNLIIDLWTSGMYRERTATITLSPGVHTVRVEYFELLDQARVRVYWTPGAAIPTATPLPAAVAPPPSGVTATIATPLLNVRNGPGVSYTTLTQVRQDEANVVIGRNSSSTWVQISGEGVSGWVNASYVTISGNLAAIPVTGADSSIPGLQARSNASLRVRSQPSTASNRRGALLRGQTAEVIGRTGDSTWLQIRLANGVTGWIAAAYVTLEGSTPLANIPVTG